MSPNEELILLQKIALEDHEAYHAIFIKYYPKLKHFITHIIKSEAIAEELSQDIFLKIWENRADLAKIHSINAYLFRMAKHISLNYLEHKYIEDAYIANHNHALSTKPEEELDAKEMEFLIQLTINRMPEQRRRIYIMSRVENIRNGEIAATLGITEKTVNNQLSLALKEIRKTLTLALSLLLFIPG